MKKLLFLVVFFSIVAGVGITTGWFADHPTLMAGLAVAGVFFVLLVGLVAGSIYSAYLIRLGGRIASDSQQANASMGTSYVNLARDVFRQVNRDKAPPALPLPSQEYQWPELVEFEQDEVERG